MDIESDRFWEKSLLMVLKKMGVEERPSEHDLSCMATTYENMGGSWVDLVKGDVDSWVLMRNVCRAYLSHGSKAKGDGKKPSPKNP